MTKPTRKRDLVLSMFWLFAYCVAGCSSQASDADGVRAAISRIVQSVGYEVTERESGTNAEIIALGAYTLYDDKQQRDAMLSRLIASGP